MPMHTPGSGACPPSPPRSTPPALPHTAQRAIGDYRWIWQMTTRRCHGSQPYPKPKRVWGDGESHAPLSKSGYAEISRSQCRAVAVHNCRSAAEPLVVPIAPVALIVLSWHPSQPQVNLRSRRNGRPKETLLRAPIQRQASVITPRQVMEVQRSKRRVRANADFPTNLRQTAWRLVAAAGTAGGVPSIVRPAGPMARPQFPLQRILSKHDIAGIQPEASHLW